MVNAKKLAVSGVLALSAIAPFAMSQAANATTIKSQNPKLGCIDILVESFGSNGSALPITQQFHFSVAGRDFLANSDFRGTGRFPKGVAKVTAWNLAQPKTYTVSTTAPAGWVVLKGNKPEHTLSQKVYVRGAGLHGCSAVTFRFQQKPVAPIKGKKVVVTTVNNTTTTTAAPASNLPDTGAGDAAAGVLGISGLGVAGRAYLRSRKSLLGAFLK